MNGIISKNCLQRLGLAPMEAKIYLTLIDRYESTASELSRITGVSSSKIYYILDALERFGLIFIQGGNPKIFRVLHPYEGFNNLKIQAKIEYEKKLRLVNHFASVFGSDESSLNFNQILEKRTNSLKERIKELKFLSQFTQELKELDNEPLIFVLQDMVERMTHIWQYPAITCARIMFIDIKVSSGYFRETSSYRTSTIISKGQDVGRIEVYYLEDMTALNDSTFLKWEQKLIDILSQILGNLYECITQRKTLKLREDELNAQTQKLALVCKITNLMQDVNKPLNEILIKIVKLLPLAFRYPSILCSRITMYDDEIVSSDFEITSWVLSKDIVIANGIIGRIDIYYKEKLPSANGDPFLHQEQEILEAISKMIGFFAFSRSKLIPSQ